MEVLGGNRTRLAIAMAFGIVSLVTMMMYAANRLSFSTLEAISKELNNPIAFLLPTETEDDEELYVPLTGEEEIRDEMHEYYYVEDGDGGPYYDDGYPDPNQYNADLYEPITGNDDIRDNLADNYYVFGEEDDDLELVNPAELGLLDDGDYIIEEPTNDGQAATEAPKDEAGEAPDANAGGQDQQRR